MNITLSSTIKTLQYNVFCRDIPFWLCLLFLFVFFSCSQPQKKSHQPNNSASFITELQTRFDQITTANVSPDSLNKLIRETHRSLMQTYPVYYDWWLQDGEHVKWFSGTMAQQLLIRLEKLNQPAADVSTPQHVNEAFNQYLKACEARREQRLASFVKNTPQVVFTKYRTLRPSFFAYTEGLSDARGECNYYAGSQLSLLRMNGCWAEEEILMSDTLGVFRDPDMHFDGKHFLFSWKKSAKEDDFHLYEMNLDNREIKQLTFGLGHADIEPLYLPDGNILFNSTRSGSAVDCWFTEVSNLFLCNRNGDYMRQVGFDQVHTTDPALLDDGRVVYTRWDYNDRGQVWTQPLFQMNPDGTGQAEYYGLNSWFPTTATHARQIPGTRKIMASIMGHHTPQHGKLAIIDPEAGRDENEGVLFVAPLRKPENERIDSYGQFGEQFQHPFPLNETDFLVSYTPLGYHIGHPMEFGIYWMHVDGGRELLVSDPQISCNQPILAAPRVKPFERVNTVDYAQDKGTYYIQNIYEGNGLRGIEPGTIKKLRIVEIEFRAASVGQAYGAGKGGGAHAGSPVGVGNTSWDLKKVHGTVDIYPDGSAFFSAPARIPLYFQALDENGFVVQTMRSWSTLQPGEFQSCVGCHEHKNTVPVAAHPVSIAMDKGVQPISPHTLNGLRNFSYIKEVQPIWDAHCIQCHDGKKQKMSLRAEMHVVDNQTKRKFSESYLSLTHARKTSDNDSWQGLAEHPEVNWISSLSEPTLLPPYSAGANTSNLIKRLQKGHGNTKISSEEISTVALWLDLLVPFISEYREANNWTSADHDYYTYYEKKREEARKEDKENIRLYLQSVSETKK